MVEEERAEAGEIEQRRKMRLLVANEPRSYREALAVTLRALEPDIQVATTEPEGLDDEVERLSPDLVICSQVTETVRNKAASWIHLYPGGDSEAVVSIRGRCSSVSEPALADIRAVIGRAGEPVG